MVLGFNQGGDTLWRGGEVPNKVGHSDGVERASNVRYLDKVDALVVVDVQSLHVVVEVKENVLLKHVDEIHVGDKPCIVTRQKR